MWPFKVNKFNYDSDVVTEAQQSKLPIVGLTNKPIVLDVNGRSLIYYPPPPPPDVERRIY